MREVIVSHIAVHFPLPASQHHVSCYHVSTCSSFARWISMERAADIKLRNTREMSKIRMYSREVRMINTEENIYIHISHFEKGISVGKRERGKEGETIRCNDCVQWNNGIARISKKESSLYFYSSRVTSSVKKHRAVLSIEVSHMRKKMISTRADYWSDRGWNNVSTVVPWIR